ncbi:MAG: hypothetical protein K0S39_2202 [Paenibacillus sp.]|jgi:hypothetical protein|nr:hypothetical protein [Paenibacillus sp.]
MSQVLTLDLEELFNQTEELYNAVLKTELPKNLKILFINNLEGVRKAFIDFQD